MLHPYVFWYYLNNMGNRKMHLQKLFQHFFHVYFMYKPNAYKCKLTEYQLFSDTQPSQ